MGQTMFISRQRAAGMALALALAVLMIGAASQQVSAGSNLDTISDYCEAQGGWLVGDNLENHTYWCVGEGVFMHCVVVPGGSVAGACVDMKPTLPEVGNPGPVRPGTAPPLIRPPADPTMEVLDLDAKYAV